MSKLAAIVLENGEQDNVLNWVVEDCTGAEICRATSKPEAEKIADYFRPMAAFSGRGVRVRLPVDYEKLLRTYMREVDLCEGSTCIDSVFFREDQFSTEELAVLKAMDEDLYRQIRADREKQKTESADD